MKKVYIILTYSGTFLSKIIKYYTRDEFSHVSISLDSDLKKMYSFGRLNPYNPFWAGFVHEGVNFGTFKRFSRTRAKVYSLEVEDEQYEKIKDAIYYIKKVRKQYKFNLLGLFAVGFKIRIKSNKAFYCAEFVKYALDKAEVKTDLPDLVRPENFKDIKNIKLEYEGLLKFYKVNKFSIEEKEKEMIS